MRRTEMSPVPHSLSLSLSLFSNASLLIVPAGYRTAVTMATTKGAPP